MRKPYRAPVAVALAALALVIPATTAAAADPGVQVLSTDTRAFGGAEATGAQASALRKVTPCTWSYFGDPRSIARREWVFTGCISTDGRVKLDEYNLETGQRRLLTLFRGL